MTKQRKRVAHVTFDMGFGGTEQVICQLVRGASNVEHRILCIDGGPGAMAADLIDEGLVVHALQRKQGLDRRLVGDMRRWFSANDIDIVHCHQYTPFVYGALSTLFTRRALIFTEHGRFYPDRGSKKRQILNPWLVRRTKAVTAISAATAQALETFEAIPRSRIQVIYNGIDDAPEAAPRELLLQELGIAPTRRVVGTIGRLDSIKNFPMMIQAFHTAREQHPDLHLLIIGDGPERPALEALIDSLGIGAHVSLTGFIAGPRHLLAAFDLFLLSSFSEGTSMSLLESMAAGLPAIVTRVGGNPELVIEGESGCVVDSEDEQGFAAELSGLMADPERTQRLGDGARRAFLARFTVAHMAAEYAKLYD